VLPQPGQHAAGDGAPVPLTQLRPLLLPLAAPPRRWGRRRRGGGGSGGGGGGEAARASGRRRGRRGGWIYVPEGVLRGHGAPPPICERGWGAPRQVPVRTLVKEAETGVQKKSGRNADVARLTKPAQAGMGSRKSGGRALWTSDESGGNFSFLRK
jgi:hypothetical protein